jgi:hypothetical protein
MKLRGTLENKKYSTLTEWEDDEDDLSPSEKALVAKADKDLSKRGVKVKDFDPDKVVGNKSSKDEDDDEAPSGKSTPKPANKTAKSTEHNGGEASTKSRGEKVAQARKFLQDHPNATRKEFTVFVANHGVSPAYANTMFYLMKNKLREVFYIMNDNGEVLAEGDEWTVFEDYGKRLQMFKSEWTAKSKTLKKGGKVKQFKL